jgi:hypothetical protein
MNVAVIDPTFRPFEASADSDAGVSSAGNPSEWIDPEGDDWLASLYRFLTEDAAPPAGRAGGPSPLSRDIEHWFG